MTDERRLLISRRSLAGAAAAAVLLAATPASHAAAPLLYSPAPAYYRFALGEAEITVVSDGLIYSGDPKKTFRGATPEEIAATLSASFLTTDKVVFDQNIMVVNTGGKLVLFDTGTGPVKTFGPDAGKLFANLAAAGIRPGDIDAVVLSHGHADHICGLVVQGRVMFENAQFYINQIDHDFWLDPARGNSGLKIFYDQALLNLAPLRDRITFIKDGEEILPGIQALLAPGHTPGHMIFMISSAGRTLALITDLARHHILNVETPRLEFVGDIDPRLCVETRVRMMNMLVQNKLPILSYHYPFPGVGHVAKWGDRYRYYPSGMLEAV